MSSHPGIICFRHCSGSNVFCKSIPEKCPICQLFIENFIIEPFCVPYPYTNAAHKPTTIVIRPSHGSFLNYYNINDQLHIGIVDSECVIHEFDKRGLVVNDRSKWTDCIAIEIVPTAWNDHWDDTLRNMLNDTKWRSQNYNANTMNCFNFVIDFLNKLCYADLRVLKKEDVCERLLLSRIDDALKYNHLYKNLEHREYFASA